MMRRHRCSECGELEKVEDLPIVNRDAGNNLHRWHLVCWRQFLWWLKGHHTDLPKKYREAPINADLDMPLARK
jgi:hypothetical protein